MEQHTRFMSPLALAAGLIAVPLASGTALAPTATTPPQTRIPIRPCRRRG